MLFLDLNTFQKKMQKSALKGFINTIVHYPFSVQDSINIASKSADYGTFGDEEVISISKGRAYGFEVLAQDKSFFGFNVILSYTFVISKFTDKYNELRSFSMGQPKYHQPDCSAKSLKRTGILEPNGDLSAELHIRRQTWSYRALCLPGMCGVVNIPITTSSMHCA